MRSIMLVILIGFALLCTAKVQHALGTLATDLHNAGLAVDHSLAAIQN